MHFDLKPLSRAGVQAAMDKVEQYRLLNEPWEAESICLDVLAVQSDHQEALIQLLLSLTDQFGTNMGFAKLEKRAKALLPRVTDEYQRIYYGGVIAERRGKAQLEMTVRDYVAYDAFRVAMEHYEKAEALSPANNDDAILRWNTCARVIANHRLKPEDDQPYEPYVEG